MAQIVRVLLNNALTHTPAGTTVRLLITLFGYDMATARRADFPAIRRRIG